MLRPVRNIMAAAAYIIETTAFMAWSSAPGRAPALARDLLTGSIRLSNELKTHAVPSGPR
jgi:hypothetical protein